MSITHTIMLDNEKFLVKAPRGWYFNYNTFITRKIEKNNWYVLSKSDGKVFQLTDMDHLVLDYAADIINKYYNYKENDMALKMKKDINIKKVLSYICGLIYDCRFNMNEHKRHSEEILNNTQILNSKIITILEN